LSQVELRIAEPFQLFIVRMTSHALGTRIGPGPVTKQTYNEDKLQQKNDDRLAVDVVAERPDLHAFSQGLFVEVGCSGNLFGEASSLVDLCGVAFSFFTDG